MISLSYSFHFMKNESIGNSNLISKPFFSKTKLFESFTRNDGFIDKVFYFFRQLIEEFLLKEFDV